MNKQELLDAIHAREREIDERCARVIRRNARRHQIAAPTPVRGGQQRPTHNEGLLHNEDDI